MKRFYRVLGVVLAIMFTFCQVQAFAKGIAYGDGSTAMYSILPDSSISVNDSAASGSPGIKGDVNSDGKVDIADAALIKSYILKRGVSINLSNADINSDGKVNTLDYMLCKTIILEGPAGYFDVTFVSPQSDSKLYVEEYNKKYLSVKVCFSENGVEVGKNYDRISVSDGAKIINKNLDDITSLTFQLANLDPVKEHTYTVIIPECAVKDSTGKVNRAFSFSFTTLGNNYIHVDGTSPYNGQEDVDINTKIVLTLDELGLKAGANINKISINNGAEITSAQVDSEGTTVTLFTSGMRYNTNYKVTVPSGAIKNILADIINDKYEFSFKTTDKCIINNNEFINLTATAPQDLQENVKAKENYLIRLSADRGGIRKGANADKISVIDNEGDSIPLKFQIDNGVLLICDGSYKYNTKYTVSIPKDSIEDASGRVNQEYSFSFTTEQEPTSNIDIVSVSPADGKVDVNKDILISVKYNTDGFVHFGYAFKDITISGGNEVLKVLSIDSDNKGKVTFGLNGSLKGNTKYTVVIPKGAFKDKAGIYSKEFTFSFATAE